MVSDDFIELDQFEPVLSVFRGDLVRLRINGWDLNLILFLFLSDLIYLRACVGFLGTVASSVERLFKKNETGLETHGVFAGALNNLWVQSKPVYFEKFDSNSMCTADH